MKIHKIKISATTYLHTFTLVTVILALIRCAAGPTAGDDAPELTASDSLTTPITQQDSLPGTKQVLMNETAIPKNEGFTPHRIFSVPSYKTAFPDSNAVQLLSAQQWGVTPVRDRTDAERRMSELVYVAASPYYHVAPLRESIAYLVPRAAVLLHDIGRAFHDSLYLKGVPLHLPIVTSILRTEEDVARLRTHNLNASENSCHRFGTTFDISYNRYVTVQTAQEQRRPVRNDTLKWILSEVLRDMRQQQRCHVKYEVKQGCFHVTVR